ncbi:MAG: tetraacyldisaccharide 4'-kinase [Alphaproteobacteria bacterium]|nr:tetraacyldisaccharide 4'-kinase [Alphaproteobacteria bacterium]
MRAPEFWTEDGLVPFLLAPLGALYGLAGAVRRALTTAIELPVPVVCVGNLTVGGTGKTPVAQAIGRYLRAQGRTPHFLSRGYGGSLAGPVRVEPRRHTAAEVGDEPLLLAEVAPTWIARDRAAGGHAAAAAGADIIVMDDGLQNPSLTKTVSIAVVDAAVGFGNRRLLPAGPLRESLASGLARLDAVILMADPAALVSTPPATHGLPPCFGARLVPVERAKALAGARVIAFAGIGRPQKFFDTLTALGALVIDTHAYPDHYVYPPEEIVRLVDHAADAEATLVTTAKDAVRIPHSLRTLLTVVEITAVFDDQDALASILPAIRRLKNA